MRGPSNYTGGTITGSLTNSGTFAIQASSAGATLTVNGSVTNTGTVHVTNTAAVFNGAFTNNGAFITDPSTVTFAQETSPWGLSGYFQASPGDVYQMKGSFTNLSTNTAWNTSGAALSFTGGTSHILTLGGNSLSLADAWGGLTLGSGDALHLVKDTTATGDGLYILGALTGLTFTGNEVTDIFDPNGITMYYLASANSGLSGTYALDDGGSLVAYGDPSARSSWPVAPRRRDWAYRGGAAQALRVG